MDQIPGAGLIDPVLRVVKPVRVRHGIEVVQVAEEFVEAMDGGQVFVQIAQMVLAELPGSVALGLKHRGQGDGLIRHAHIGSGLSHRGQTGADRQLPSDEVGAPRRTTGFGIVVGKPHAVCGQFVKIGRLAGHHALVIGSDIKPANVVTHDKQNVRFFLSGGRTCSHGEHSTESDQYGINGCSIVHFRPRLVVTLAK